MLSYYSPVLSYYSPVLSYYFPVLSYHSPVLSYYSPALSYYSPVLSYYSTLRIGGLDLCFAEIFFGRTPPLSIPSLKKLKRTPFLKNHFPTSPWFVPNLGFYIQEELRSTNRGVVGALAHTSLHQILPNNVPGEILWPGVGRSREGRSGGGVYSASQIWFYSEISTRMCPA